MGQVTSCLVDDRGTWTVSFPDDDNKSIQLILKGSGNQKTVAVTGANGFIGSQIVNLLLRKGYKVRGTVQYHEPKLVNFLKLLPNAAKNLTLHEKDIVDGCFDDVFQGCDCVFHTASPTLKHQREMKEPHVDMYDHARFGTANVLESCKKNGVGTVVITSSMCSAIPKTNAPSGGLKAKIYEDHWANPDFLKKKGSHYAASKTLAEKDAVKSAKDSPIRLVRICPSFTIGPMLQPTVNSSMERFARICAGIHHEQIPNRSISFVDVRDTAAHHVAAYEKGKEVHGRYFSTTESWHWTRVYDALKVLNPQMKCPKPLPDGIRRERVREYSTSRMKSLGVTERSLFQVLEGGVKAIKNISLGHGSVECHDISAIPAKLSYSFRAHAGYYASVESQGTFFMIEAITNFYTGQEVSYSVYLSWFFPGSGRSAPTCIQIQQNSEASFVDGKLVLGVYKIILLFKPTLQGYSVRGTIEGHEIYAVSSVLPVPSILFATTYKAKDGTSVTLTLGGTDSTIIDYQGQEISNFIYNPTMRQFEYLEGPVVHQLYLNAAVGHGLRLTFVEYDPSKLPGTTKFFYLSPNYSQVPKTIEPTGAEDLAAFAGYYPFQNAKFVSIVGTQGGSSNDTPSVSVCICDGSTSKVYTSFTFDNSTGTLTFPLSDLTLKFQSTSSFDDYVEIRERTKVTMDQDTALNCFSTAPLSAFGSYTLNGDDASGQNKYSLQIENVDGGEQIVYKKNDQNVFDPTTPFEYSAVEQIAVVGEGEGEIVFNLTYHADKGISCGVTTPNGLQSALSAFSVET